MSRRYLVTGGAGFIGSNFIRQLLAAEPDAEVTNLDLLTYAGVKATVDELDTDDRHRFVHGDIRVPKLVNQLVATSDIIVNFAAESHVDRSITGPTVFLETNIIGTGVLLDAARKADIARFVHVSTDEVYGSISTGYPTEEAPLRPSSPYSVSKAAADLLVQSYAVTYGYGAMITRCTNNYGPYQFPEKVIPLFATNLFEGKKVPLYGDGKAERDWLMWRTIAPPPGCERHGCCLEPTRTSQQRCSASSQQAMFGWSTTNKVNQPWLTTWRRQLCRPWQRRQPDCCT